MSEVYGHIQFDDIAKEQVKTVKILTENLDAAIRGVCPTGSRYTSLALTSLEEMFMWTGKSIRDAQIARSKPNDEGVD